jgi:hypothetical protein
VRVFLASLSSLSAALFIAKTKQQCFKLIKCLLFIGSDRLDQDMVAAIRLALISSSMLAAEKFSLPLQIVIVLLNHGRL